MKNHQQSDEWVKMDGWLAIHCKSVVVDGRAEKHFTFYDPVLNGVKLFGEDKHDLDGSIDPFNYAIRQWRLVG